MRKVVTLMLMLLILSCGHKAAPLVKDRFSPRLQKISVLNTRQVQLSFSEEIDTVALAPDSIQIASARDTLKIVLSYPSLSASEIVLVTAPMAAIEYEISGHVYDKAENKGSFKSNFQGSTTPDTITPWVASYSQGRNNHEFFLVFSEAMDTTSLAASIIPTREFITIWQNYRHVRFIPATGAESLGYDTTYYLYLKNASDISGNPVMRFVTSITPDTVYRPTILRGQALINDAPVRAGIAVLVRERAVAISIIDNGTFSFEVRDSLPYDIQVLSNGYTGTGKVALDSENIIILTEGQIDIDYLID
ncbi:hypothetical protein AMJ83_02455 [candidate division WOR_3 bacterium SM23_42]|uniref:SbsA Ig-like domain-containing protein n=1 Tax=candidate division WOR_3 bacterium SM23_42 TaxID=1703779 RepID=A0A0S8FXD1_UNCW3|nr:MAG: hypothetical protein AMJ83_02455 [candidate division WOR_3 bacterium SM23_42]